MIKIDCRVRVGEIQAMSFELKLFEPPPFFNILDAPYEDKIILDSDGNISKTKTGKERKIKGYAGEAKGLAQVRWERALWKAGMKKELNVDDKVFSDLCASTTLGHCHDFREKIRVMKNLVLSRGHICLFSPKGHPEIAGAGIEYNWGVSKKSSERKTSMFQNNVSVMYVCL